jgi:hypothetical protein
MQPVHILAMVAVLFGIGFLLAAIATSRKGNLYIPEELRKKWLLLMRFMVFFLSGYIFFLLILIAELPFPVEPVAGSVFLAGAVFVFLMINLSLTTIRRTREHEEEIATLYRDLQRSNADLVLAYDTTIEGWARALELRDKDTEGHTRRVYEMTVQVAQRFGLGEEELAHVRRGAMLHDIGKMGVPDSILLKPESLTEEEWTIMKKHPEYAFQMLAPIAYLRPALDIPYCHHEKWDGSGYPRGLKGEQIPLAARIFTIADMWDALCSERMYHLPWPRRKVCDHIRGLAGSQFDPKVVEVFMEMDWCKEEGSTYCKGDPVVTISR